MESLATQTDGEHWTLNVDFIMIINDWKSIIYLSILRREKRSIQGNILITLMSDFDQFLSTLQHADYFSPMHRLGKYTIWEAPCWEIL